TTGITNNYALYGVGTSDAEAPRAPKDLFVDTTPLEKKMDEIESKDLVENEFTNERWDHLQKELDEAKAFLENTADVTQADIVEQIKAIDKAYDGLQTASKQFSTDFSDYEIGGIPSDWSTLWRDSGWEIKENPTRLEHFVTEGGKRRVL